MQAQEKFLTKLLASNLRIDGRQPLQTREAKAQFLKQNGQLFYSQGNTSVVVKVKAEITAPRQERPAQGWVHFRVDCLNCQGNVEQNRKLSAEAVKLLETVVVGSKALDPESLCILSGRYVWRVTVEATVVIDDGNVLDCLLNGSVLALIDTRKPLVKLDQTEIEVEQNVKQPLSLAHIPISLTFGLFEGNIYSDPLASQQRVAKSRITITMNVYKQLCSIHKPGGLGITQKTLSECVKVVELQVAKATTWMREIAKERPLFLNSL